MPECSKPHQWQADEAAVRAGTCNFYVKYLGCVEVFESRGMQVCEEALKMLRNSRRRPVKGILYVTGDGLRVVDDETKGLIVDQTIEKVSFCAPDRNHDKGFSYICRDGTTRRWMCHGFLAVKDSGERLSHAVGCAFAACLERKQKRDKECGVSMTFDQNNSTFTRLGSFRQSTMTERMQEVQVAPVTIIPAPLASVDLSTRDSPLSLRHEPSLSSAPPTAAAVAAASSSSVAAGAVTTFIPSSSAKPQQGNPFAVERPHATPFMLQRQGSFRGFSQLNQTSPFKRQLSLRLNDLPSNVERHQRAMSLESSEFDSPTSPVSPIPESSPVAEKQQQDSISAMCQQVAQGLSLLSSSDDPFSPTFGSPPSSAPAALPSQHFVARNGVEPIRETNPWMSSGPTAVGMSRAEMWLATNVPSNSSEAVLTPPSVTATISQSQVTKSASNPLDLFGSTTAAAMVPPPPRAQPPIGALPPPRKAPHIAHLRSQSLGTAELYSKTVPSMTQSSNWATFNGSGNSAVAGTTTTAAASSSSSTMRPSSASASGTFRDPFDAEWATVATSKPLPSTNPFAQGSVKTFEIHM